MTQPGYNPATRTVLLPQTFDRFQHAHENAHKDQHHENGWLWRTYQRVFRWPFIGAFVQALLEFDANLRALRKIGKPTDDEFRLAGIYSANYLIYSTGITWVMKRLLRVLR